jgi:hypothetical protein
MDQSRTSGRLFLDDLQTRSKSGTATARHPRQRYTAGKLARQISLLRRFVPEKMFDKSLRKELRLPV